MTIEALPVGTYKTVHSQDEFLDLEIESEVTLRDDAGDLWVAFSNDNGDWFAVRPANEDEAGHNDVDPHRPIGPTSLTPTNVPLPWTVSVHPFAPVRTERVCAYRKSEHHSDDFVTLFCGRPAPVTLCGMHAQGNISHILATIPEDKA